MLLLAPVHKFYPNNLENPHDALAPVVGLLVADWNGVDRPPLMATGDTTLFGEGQRQGIEVRVPNEGSQWQPAYLTPNIDVQVVDSNPEIVAQQARRVSAELNGLLEARQDALGILPGQRLTTMVSPSDPTILYVSGSRTRSGGHGTGRGNLNHLRSIGSRGGSSGNARGIPGRPSRGVASDDPHWQP